MMLTPTLTRPAPKISTPDYIGRVTAITPHLAKAIHLLYLYLVGLMVRVSYRYGYACGSGWATGPSRTTPEKKHEGIKNSSVSD